MSYGNKLASLKAGTRSFIIWLSKNYETRINPHHCAPRTICEVWIRTAPFVSAQGGPARTIPTGHGTKNLGGMCGAGMPCKCNSGEELDVSQVLIDEKDATRH